MAPMGATELAAEAIGEAVGTGEAVGVVAADGELMAAGSVATGAGVVGSGSTGPADNILH